MPGRVAQAMQLLRGVPRIAVVQLLRGLPGILLVTGGGFTLYVSSNATGSGGLPAVAYALPAFGFLTAIAGIVLLFREMGQAGVERAGFDPTKAATDIERVIGQLGKNYDILRQHTKAGFVLAALFMGLGIVVVLVGAAGQTLGLAQGSSNITAVTGVIVEAISVIGFYLFRTSFKELTVTSERLHGMLLLLDAFKRAESLPEEEKTPVMVELIRRLVDYDRDHQSEADAKAA